jgi:hypothetical protein
MPQVSVEQHPSPEKEESGEAELMMNSEFGIFQAHPEA